MYSPEVKSRIEFIRSTLPSLTDPEKVRELMKEAVALIREGRVAASATSANAQRKKAKAVVLDVDSLLGDLESGLPA